MAAARKRAEQRRRLVTLGPLVVVIVGLLAFFIATSNNKSKSSKVSSSTSTTAAGPPTTVAPAALYGTTPCPRPDGSSPRTTKFSAPFQKCINPVKHYVATMKTDVGAITIALDPTKAPATVNNFVALARYHFFDGLTFHRVIPDFVDQGGDPNGNGSGGPGYQFSDELPTASDYKAGSLAMANSGPNTNGSQFFIVVSANGAKSLVQAVSGKANYSLFGQITAGLDVALKINTDGDPSGTPKVVHKIVSVSIAES
jgi:cyclophilin family peptidyl-prolyl cis-trans isomerase